MNNIMEKKIDLFYENMNTIIKDFTLKEYCNEDDYNNIVSSLLHELQTLLKNTFNNKILDLIGFEFKKISCRIYIHLVNKRTGQYITSKKDFIKAIEIPLIITIDFKSDEK